MNINTCICTWRCLCFQFMFVSSMRVYLRIVLMSRLFASCPGDRGSIPDRVIPKTQKMVLDAVLLNTLRYKVRIKGKLEQLGKEVAPSLIPRCRRSWKGSLRAVLDYVHQLYLLIYPGKVVAPSSIPRCNSSWKGSLRVALVSGSQLYLLYLFFKRNVIVYGIKML